MPIKNPVRVAKQALATLASDRTKRLLRIDKYEQGEQDLPYTPELADEEYVALSKRAITNVMPFLLGTPAQMLYVDSFRRGRTSDGTAEFESTSTDAVQPEWDHWQNSRLDAMQSPIIRGALKFGHSFTLTETVKEKVLTKGLSALKTIALYEDAVNDADPYAALSIVKWGDAAAKERGKARMWDDAYEYEVTFVAYDDLDSVKVKRLKKHGASVCPVTRFAAAVDLEGRTCGVVEPMMVLQDRINQTVFDLLIVQSYASFKVRTIAGMTPPIKMKPIDIDGNTVLDPENNEDKIEAWVPMLVDGKPVPDEVNLNAKRVFFAEDKDTKFGTLDETPLDGFIAAIELAFRHMAALSQTPPHHILGEISNLSAEALDAAETALMRKVDEFKSLFGESWERVFRLAAELQGIAGANDFSGEVIWRDTGHAALSQTADALIKLKDLGIPGRGLWGRVPGVTAVERAEWGELADREQPDAALAESTRRASSSTRPGFRLGAETGADAA